MIRNMSKVPIIINKHKLKMREYTDIWSRKPKLFGAVALIGLVALMMTSFDIGYEGGQMHEEVGIQRSIASAFDEAPALMLKQLESQKNTMSAYQYELKKAQYEFFASKAPIIADRIRDDVYWNVFVKSSKILGTQAAQAAVGKVAGKATKLVGDKIGYKVATVGQKLVSKGYYVAGSKIASKGFSVIRAAEEFGDKSANLIWEVVNAAGRENTPTTPTLQKAMSKPEFAELFRLLKEATERNPDKLMEAHLNNYISLAKNAHDRPDDEYRTAVMITAQNLANLTKSGGSSDSMWQDVDELAKWIASKIGRPLPEEPEDEKPETVSLARFRAHGEFTGLEEKLHYAPDHWNLNSISIVVEDWKIVDGAGILHREVETEAIHTYDKNTFKLIGDIQQSSQGTNVIGIIKNAQVIHTRETYSSVTGDKETHEKRFSFSATIYLGGRIEGSFNDWPGDFILDSNIE